METPREGMKASLKISLVSDAIAEVGGSHTAPLGYTSTVAPTKVATTISLLIQLVGEGKHLLPLGRATFPGLVGPGHREPWR